MALQTQIQHYLSLVNNYELNIGSKLYTSPDKETLESLLKDGLTPLQILNEAIMAHLEEELG